MQELTALWRKYNFLLFIAAGIAVIVFGLLYYLSSTTRLNLYGVKLDHRVALHKPENFLVGWHSHVESWTEINGRLDTPLASETAEEVSTVLLERVPGTPTQNVLMVRPQEWIRSLKGAEGFKNEMIPQNHPSIAPATVIIDKQGTLLERRPAAAWRTGRALQFLIPEFPKGTLRRGSSWTEHLEWTEVASDWRIGWQADLQWVLKDFETRYDKPCALLVYDAVLQPTVLQSASWAKGSDKVIQFKGQASGQALYDVKDKFLISNTFSYGGVLKIHVPNLEDVPEELRIGLSMSQTGGEVALKLDDKLDVRLP